MDIISVMRIKEKKFTHGALYDDKGNIYYKPLEKFAKFGTSGVRWLVKGAADVLAKFPEKVSYYFSNGYKRTIENKEVLAEDFNIPNMGAVIKSIALYNLQKAEGAHSVISGSAGEFKKKLFEKGLLVMYDNRPGNFEYAQEGSKILAAYGIKAVLTRSDGKFVPTPLPAISRLVQVGGYAGSVNFTASHNGDEWNGIKFEAEDGGSASPKITNVIGAILAEELALKDPAKQVTYKIAEDELGTLIKEGRVGTIDTLDFYVNEVSRYLNINVIKKAITEGRVEFIYSAFFGSSGPTMIKLFQKLGLPTDKIIETQKSADQGYVSSYEPTLDKLKRLTALVNARGMELSRKGAKTAVIGGAADNDADRFQVNQFNNVTNKVDEFTPDKLSAVLAHYLYKYKGFKGPAGRSFVSGSLLDEVAKLFGQRTIETATGFKFSPEVFITNGGIIFTEESYGLSFQGWTLDKDGVLPSLLALELVAVTGKDLEEYYKDMLAELEHAKLASKIYFKRFDMPLESKLKEQAIKRFTEFFDAIKKGGTTFAGKIVTARYDPKDYDGGMKFVMADGSWMAFRSSGTEPLVRLYIEAGSEEYKEILRKEALKLMGISG